ncbi:Ku protein [Marinimicrobium sp. ABcell2]|uniref:non-homologous end joining protein Ku n=1 Tax=Marinimicrobium sp. ABcell2 TaxID=3069751 RepID=UPI0027AE3ECF|nr:Ku protein [Marinimicrobium sp. ABcell2]MDQ2077572.1 Ku protein [Marinimicrobium sp. ABcell2]
MHRQVDELGAALRGVRRRARGYFLMAARAIWKGRIRCADADIPVKLYSAIEDRAVHFRLLHKTDKTPVKQALINPETEVVVPFGDTWRAYSTGEGQQVLLTTEELDDLKPEPSRDIQVLKFLPLQAIDHRWYDRPYYLGPDDSMDRYAALAQLLSSSGREALVHWVMRNKEYYGALSVFRGYPMLMSLRHTEQVVSVDELQAPAGKPLDEKELAMARQLIGMLEADFSPEEYHDEYRERVLELVEKKQRGGGVERPPPSQKPAPDDLIHALEASLKEVRAHG